MARLTFRALDAYGNQRPYVSGDVTLTLAAPQRWSATIRFVRKIWRRRRRLRPVGARPDRAGHGHGGTPSAYATTRLTVTPALGRSFLLTSALR